MKSVRIPAEICLDRRKNLSPLVIPPIIKQGLDKSTGFLTLSRQDKVSYINTVRSLYSRKNHPLTTRKLPYVKKSLREGLLLQSDDVDYVSLLNTRTKDKLITSLRDFGITDFYPSWTKTRIVSHVIENHKEYLNEEYKDFAAVVIPPALEPWCAGFVSVIESRYSCDSELLKEWDRRFEKFL